MSQLFETLRILNGQVQHLDYHNQRCNRSRKALFNTEDIIDLGDYISVPDYYTSGQAKCKLVYGNVVEEVFFQAYEVRKISTIKMIIEDAIDYPFKFKDRDQLSQLFRQRGQSDEILIIKNGMVTDCFYYNVAFFDGSNWVTPKDCLLQGVMRAALLDSKQIKEAAISTDDISDFSEVRLFNALTPFGEIELNPSAIMF